MKNDEARGDKVREALNAAAYALFQIKRMVGVPQHVIDFVREEHAKACEVLNETPLSAAAPIALPAGYKLLKDSTFDDRSWKEEEGHENGRYYNTCCVCERQFLGHKRRVLCKVCDAEKVSPYVAQSSAAPITQTPGELATAPQADTLGIGVTGRRDGQVLCDIQQSLVRNGLHHDAELLGAVIDSMRSATQASDEIVEAANALLDADDMIQHNVAIFKGKWKKGSKAWSTDFIDRTRKESLAKLRAILRPSAPKGDR
jgi:hypothetical protein